MLALSNCFAADTAGAEAFEKFAVGEVNVSRTARDHRVRLVRATGNGDLWPSRVSQTATSRARAFLNAHAAELGVAQPDSELVARQPVRDAFGFTVLRFAQQLQGIDVHGSGATLVFAPDGRLLALSAGLVDTSGVDTRASISADAAATIAGASPLAAPRRVVYSALRQVSGRERARLAWEVVVGDGQQSRDFVYIDAHTGKVLDRINGIEHDLSRRVYDGGFGDAFVVWQDGDPEPFGVTDIDNILQFGRDTYNLYASLSGGAFLSWDNADGTLQAVTHPPGMSCPNASWNGLAARFCPGYTGDDVVAHEFTHGYTDSTHDLIYRWQPGALNEAYSDIFGEIVDMLNGAGVDLPHEPRLEQECSVFGGLLPPLQVDAPAALAGRYSGGGASFNPAGVTAAGRLVQVDDGTDEPTDACTAVVNGDDIMGHIALVENRGRCAGLTQVINAQNAGAAGVLYVNTFSDVYYNLSGTNPVINIPTVVIGRTLGEALVNAIDNAAVDLDLAASVDPSLRWLHREDFNFVAGASGANRDMWNPNCFGDPARVSDPLYYCASGDSGGVHHNSGVINHLFARLVDGGSYNGHVIQPVGLVKAAHLYWRAMSSYQVPDSDFSHHADALTASCDDLVIAGMPLPTPDTASPLPVPSAEMMTVADCAALAGAIAAVELRNPPDQCNFQPLLAQQPPPLCGAGQAVQHVFADDFETGQGDWTAGTRAVLDPATFDTPDWSVVSALPQNRPGSAAFVADLITGNCSTDSEAGVLYFDSPVIVLPAKSLPAMLSFVHSVATESNWDGGNLKLSVNGEKFNLVPDTAITYNAYTGVLNPGDNPLGGEPAWYGSDGNSLSGQWGQTQVSLQGLAAPGDSVVVRFDFGVDGCNGLKGWYVDDVRVSVCNALDSDADTVDDTADNCTLQANTDQRDTDSDGFGNACDGDLNNDCAVTFADLGLLKAAFYQTPFTAGWNANADFNGDGFVNFHDLAVMRAQFFGLPGPSGIETICP